MNPIRKIRTEAGLSQAKFAQMLNVHKPLLANGNKEELLLM